MLIKMELKFKNDHSTFDVSSNSPESISLQRYSTKKKPNSLNGVFKLTCVFTCYLLLVLGSIVGIRQFLGNPIECTNSADDIPKELVNSYCWYAEKVENV